MLVWSTIARARGGSVGGVTAGEFAAYYIAGNMTVALAPLEWEREFRPPIHAVRFDVLELVVRKLLSTLAWVPYVALLSFVFRPELDVTGLEVAVFAVAIWGAYLAQALLLGLLGLLGPSQPRTARSRAVVAAFFAGALLLSGRRHHDRDRPDSRLFWV